jgi:PKD repeat protein
VSPRFALLAISALVAGVAAGPAPAAAPAGAPPGAGSPRPLPAHSQRPVCGPPAAQTASCHAHVVTYQDSADPLASSSYQSGWSPANLASAYNLPTLAGLPGSGPTVAIVDAYDNPNAETDLNAYRSQFGLGACTTANGCFSKVNQTGGSLYPAGDTGWGSEIDLDIEMVAAACPACKILLVEANSNSFTNLMTAVDYATGHAKFVSNSYGAPEFSGETTYDFHFNHPGVSITVSSGDNGYGVEYPAASRYVAAVGGTSLTQNASLPRGWSETAWSGAGSGCSALETKPSWQHDTGCSRRTVADVSAVANPNTGVAVYDSYGSSNGANWFVYGGTSVAAPFVAAVWALGPAVGGSVQAPSIPYSNLGGWYDVTSGSNASRCNTYLCKAVSGYDGPTGLGSPTGASGFGGTVGSGGGGGGGGNTAPVASFTWSCPTLTCTFTNTSTDAENNITGYTWTFGDGSSSSATSPSHAYSNAGPWTVTLTATDNGNLSDQDIQSVTATPPSGGITLTASGFKNKGVNTVNLSWTGGSGPFTINRNGSFYANDSASPYTDNTGTKGGATFTYQVCDASTCSNTATVVF